MANGEDQAAGIDFLDFIFTVSVGVGLTPEVLQLEVGGKKITGVLSQSWLQSGHLPNHDEFWALATLFLCFLTLTLSWFGYHASIKRRPLRYDSPWGMARFVLDVLLVLMYGVAMLLHKNLPMVLFLLMASYGLFVVWDVFKVIEHIDKYRYDPGKGVPWKGRFRRELVSLFWFAVFMVLWLSRNVIPTELLILLALISTVLYRVNKYVRLWERPLRIPHG